MAKVAEQRRKEDEERKKQAEFDAMPEAEKLRVRQIQDALKKKNEGNEFYKKKKFAEAIQCYNQAINLDPTELTYHTNLAACYFELAEYDKCIEACDNAIARAKESGGYDFEKMGKAMARKANALFKQGKMDESLSVYA
jgi:stress-induced-phosphoprotein 1